MPIPRPDDLNVDQIKEIIDDYDALPNASLDAEIRSNLREYKKNVQALSQIETDIQSLETQLATAKGNLEKQIERLNEKAKKKNAGKDYSEDNIIDRHFELDGIVPVV